MTFAGSSTAGAIASTFVNLFVFVVSGRLTDLALFNGAYFFALTFVFFAVAHIFRRRTPLAAYQWGLALTAVFYGSLLGLLGQARHDIVFLGLFYGVAQGVFWFGINLMTFDTVPGRDRIRFYGWSSAIGSVTGVAGPLLGGALVSLVPHLAGYLLVFGLALLVYAGTFVVSLTLPAGPPLGPTPLALSFTLPKASPLWRRAFVTLVLRGTREGITGMAGIYLVYLATRAAWAVGLYAGVTALVRMMTSLGVVRWVTPGRRVIALWTGVAGMTLSAMLLLISPGVLTVFVYGVATAASLPWYTVPNEAIPLDVMDADPAVGERRVAYTLSREMALNIGRLASIAILAVGYAGISQRTVLIGLLVLTSSLQGVVAVTAAGVWAALGKMAEARR